MASRTSSPLLHPEEEDLDFRAVLAALSDPIRLGLVVAIAEAKGVYCGRFDLPVGKSAASHHFRILREAGLIRQWDVGTRRLNVVRREELDRRFPGLLDLALAEGAPLRIPLLSEQDG